MPFIYHFVPKEEMWGTILYPLNMLKDLKPELYESYIKKYQGRTEITDAKISPLDCKWNDVLHFSPVHPNKIVDAYRKLGKYVTPRFFEISADLLEPEKTVFYLNSPREKGTAIPQSDFIPYNPKEVERYDHMPEATEAYYKETFEAGGNPLAHHLIPHVLYKGSIETKDLAIRTTLN